MSPDYKEYKEFLDELKEAGVKSKKELTEAFKKKFDYLADDEVSIIFLHL